jgi:FAD:protein FMN transferase
MKNLQKRMRPLLGCFVEIALPVSATGAQVAFNSAFASIELIQKLLSFHDPASDLSRLNSAQGRAVNCHPLSIQCLRLAQATTRISNGRFNCTLGAVLTACAALPNHNFQDLYGTELLAYGDWRDMELTRDSARLRKPVLITLDGIAKGFAVDCAVAELKRTGISEGWINAGGDIRVFGDLVLPIAVRDHLGINHLLGGIQNAAIATSTSNANREFPGLLLDSAGNQIPPLTSTVIARSAWRADALTKVAAATSAAERTASLARLGGRWIAISDVDQSA